MGKTIRQMANMTGVSTSNIYYYLKKRNMLHEYEEKPQENNRRGAIYSDEVVDLILSDIESIKNKENKDKSYWEARSNRLARENKQLKQQLNKYAKLKDALNLLKDVALDGDVSAESEGKEDAK